LWVIAVERDQLGVVDDTIVGGVLAATARAVAAATQRAKNITSARHASRTPAASHDSPCSPSFVSLGQPRCQHHHTEQLVMTSAPSATVFQTSRPSRRRNRPLRRKVLHVSLESQADRFSERANNGPCAELVTSTTSPG
jgi:hypothetical protein